MDEGLVAILRDREPDVAISIGKTRPSPLAGMAVLVVDEKVHQSRLEKGSGINAVAATLFHVLPHGLRPADLAGAGESGGIAGTFGGMFLQRPDQAGKFLAVFPEPGIVRNHHERVLRMEDAGGLHERIDHQRRGWQQRADQILKDFTHDRVLDFVLQPLGGVFVERANRVAAAVFSGEVKRDGLPEAPGPKRRQTAPDAIEVEDRNLYGSGPEIPVVVAVEPAFGRAGPEPFSGNHQVRPGARGRNRSVDSGARLLGIFLRRSFGRNRKSEPQREQDGEPPWRHPWQDRFS